MTSACCAGRRCHLVVENGATEGLLTPHEVKAIEQERWPYTTVYDTMVPVDRLKTVNPETPAAEALEMLGRADVNQLTVVSNGRLEEIFSRARVMQFLFTRAESDMKGNGVMNILLAVDGSDHSFAAADVIAHRPWPPGSAVKIISVVRLPFTPTTETRSLPDSDYSRLESAAMKQAKEAVDGALTRIIPSNAGRETPLTITSDVLLGQEQETILAQSEEWGADLIVIGSRGLGGFKRFLLGSVSGAVAAHANCSVEVVRLDESRPVKKSHMKILLAVDGSAYSDAAAIEAASRPWPADSDVKIISAVESIQSLRLESWGLPHDSSRKLEKALEAEARGAVDKAAAQFRQTRGQKVAVLSEVIPGRARDVILDDAENWGADLIMLGSRGLGGVARLLLGSVSSATLAYANCSVEIVRQRRAD